eukprot:6982555-Prymnesium_polylepis.1
MLEIAALAHGGFLPLGIEPRGGSARKRVDCNSDDYSVNGVVGQKKASRCHRVWATGSASIHSSSCPSSCQRDALEPSSASWRVGGRRKSPTASETSSVWT